MTRLIKAVKIGVLAAVAAGGLTVMSAQPASAHIACNRFGECWHVADRYTNYPANMGVRFYDDSWRKQHRGKNVHWREVHGDDHGYYDHGRWHGF